MLCYILLFMVPANAWFNPFAYDAYAPKGVSCPPGNLLRTADSLSNEEVAWLEKRNSKTQPALITFLLGLNLTDSDAQSFVTSATKPITLGLTFSGGSYRAMLNGAGALSAFDARTASDDNGLKGILQASAYIVGLSGGSWLVGSLAMNDFISIDEVLETNLWDLRHSVVDPGFLNPFTNVPYYIGISAAVAAKALSAFKVSVADIWSLAISRQFLGRFKADGAGLTYSSLASNTESAFYNADMPFPIITALTRSSNSTGQVNYYSAIIEFNPFEMGSWDAYLNSFVQLKYAGSLLDGGVNYNGNCVTGFDNAGFVMGTSSCVFTAIFYLVNLSGFPKFLQKIINGAVIYPYENLKVVMAEWDPNPFFNSTATGYLQSQTNLPMVDGGIDYEGIPFEPLLQPERNIDVIFAQDSSGEVDGWSDGHSLIATHDRQIVANGPKFPPVPNVFTFRNGNLTARPAFFGCYESDTPLVVYFASRPFSYWSNTSAAKLSYSEYEKRGMIRNGYEVVTRLNGTIDPEWSTCVGCAVISREQRRQGVAQSDQCKNCFSRYCWDGTLYTGPARGDNFADSSLTESTQYYNSTNVEGFNDGGVSLFKRWQR